MEPTLTEIDLAMNSIKEELFSELYNTLASNMDENTNSVESRELNS